MLKHSIQTVVFDYDGTLHDTMQLYKPAFMKAYEFLKAQGIEEEQTFTDADISKYLGYTAQEMWDLYDPHLDPTIRDTASKIITQTMVEGMRNGTARLFEGAYEVLKTLKERGYTLVFLSNCQHAYMAAHTALFHLDTVFDVMVCSEDHSGAPKRDILHALLKDLPSGLAVVGDRHHDIDAGKANGAMTFGCAYGYGQDSEIADADIHLNSIQELLHYL